MSEVSDLIGNAGDMGSKRTAKGRCKGTKGKNKFGYATPSQDLFFGKSKPKRRKGKK